LFAPLPAKSVSLTPAVVLLPALLFAALFVPFLSPVKDSPAEVSSLLFK